MQITNVIQKDIKQIQNWFLKREREREREIEWIRVSEYLANQIKIVYIIFLLLSMTNEHSFIFFPPSL